jgi:phosphatidylethanolamine/phosphatidyl-N-methylethanolamine N-methyltransferase
LDSLPLPVNVAKSSSKSRAQMPLHALQLKIEKKIRLFEAKNGIRLNDEVRFIRSWMEKPLAIGAVTPSSRVLARAMARYVNPETDGPVVELGPGTGPVTEALVAQGIAPERLVLVEFDPQFCDILRNRYPEATVVQGDAYQLGWLMRDVLRDHAAAVVSGLPLVVKPMRMRTHLLRDALDLLRPKAPFVQFTYSVAPPIARNLRGVHSEASPRIWLNLPPARVWVYRRG